MHCPNCGSEYREGVEECVDCKVDLVTPPSREAPRRAPVTLFPTIPKRERDRPAFVRAVPWIATLICLLSSYNSLLCLGKAMPSLPIRLNPSKAHAAEFYIYQSSPWMSALLWVGLAFLAFLIAYSFWRQRPWGRHLLVALLALEAVRQLLWHPEELENLFFFGDTGIPSMVVLLAFVGCYFYLKPNVASYFRRLESVRAEKGAPRFDDAPGTFHRMSFALHYTEPLVRRGVRRFSARSIGWAYPIAVLLLASSFAFGLARGNRSWTSGLLGAVLGYSILVPLQFHRKQRAAALADFQSLDGKPIAFGGNEESFSLQSPAGSAEHPWRAISEVWWYEDFWLLVFSKGNFMTFPLDGVPALDQAFLLERVKAHGGKIS